MENKNRAWIYCRIDAPEDSHGALKSQRKQLMDYADQMEFTVVGCSEDTASGLDFERNGLKRIMDAAGRGDMDILIIHDLSRIGRSICEALKYLNQLKQMSVSVYSPLVGKVGIHDAECPAGSSHEHKVGVEEGALWKYLLDFQKRR